MSSEVERSFDDQQRFFALLRMTMLFHFNGLARVNHLTWRSHSSFGLRHSLMILLQTFVTLIFAFASASAVPVVEIISNPSFTNSRATGITASLSASLTLMNTFPFFGSGGGAAIWDFA